MQVIVPSVKDMVVRSVEGLTADHVAVTLFPATSMSVTHKDLPITRFFGALVAPESVSTLWILLGIPWALVVILSLVLIFSSRLRGLFFSDSKFNLGKSDAARSASKNSTFR
jgi:type III secretion protein J